MDAASNQSNYSRYREETSEDISKIIEEFGCQPILFIGSGLPRRYLGAPSWDELLMHLAKECPLIDKDYGYYKQTLKSPLNIGELFAEKYQEWAWSSGRDQFPSEMFEPDVSNKAYFKYKVSEYIKSITLSIDQLFSGKHSEEIKSLQRIKPHAIVTTNYDEMIEEVFPDHEPIVGQKILKGQIITIGEIYKIHGCVSSIDSIVLTKSDYDFFEKKKKFLSAKLLTFFNEHPLIFIGYSASDPNIQAILSDIDEALPEKGGVIPNVYILEWNPNLSENSSPGKEKLIPTEDGRSLRVKLIEASDFSWVFDVFAANPALNDVNPKILRALIARSYHLVRHDIPKSTVQADFSLLTESVENSSSFAKLFGIADIDKYAATAAIHPFSTTQLGIMLGGNTWHIAVKLIKEIVNQTGIDIRTSDNRYHRTEKINSQRYNKYSRDAVELLKSVRDGHAYKLDLDIDAEAVEVPD